MEEIVAHMEWDADEVVVVSGVPGVTAQVLVQVVALNEADAGSHSQVVNCQIFCPDTSRHSRSHLIGSSGQARYIRIEHAATDARFSLHLPSVGGLLSLNALAAEAKGYGKIYLSHKNGIVGCYNLLLLFSSKILQALFPAI